MKSIEKLRALLHDAPKKDTWSRIVEVLDAWPGESRQELIEVAVPYCYQHLVRWPTKFKTTFQGHWFRAWVQGDQDMIHLLELCDLHQKKDPATSKTSTRNSTYYRIDYTADERKDYSDDAKLVNYQVYTSDRAYLEKEVAEIVSRNFCDGHTESQEQLFAMYRKGAAFHHWLSPDRVVIFVNGRALRTIALIPDVIFHPETTLHFETTPAFVNAAPVHLRLRRPLCTNQFFSEMKLDSSLPDYRVDAPGNSADLLSLEGEVLAEAVPNRALREHPLMEPYQGISAGSRRLETDIGPLLGEIPALRALRPLPESRFSKVREHAF